MQTISKMFSDILNDIANEVPYHRSDLDIDQVKSDVEYLINTPILLKQLIVSSLELHKLKAEDILDFFGRLAYLSFKIEIFGRFCAMALLSVFEVLPQKHAQNILDEAVSGESRMIWRIKYLLPDLLTRFRLDYEFALKWFLAIHLKVENDMMNRPFYNAIENYALTFPNDGKKIVHHYMHNTDESDLKQIAWIVLGAIRVSLTRSGQQKKIQNLDNQLKSSNKVEYRELYILSLITTFQNGGLEFYELLEIIQEDDNQSEVELNAKSFLIYTILVDHKVNPHQINQLLNELRRIVVLMPSYSIKYWSIKSITHLQLQIHENDLNEVLLSIFKIILPIEVDQIGLWKEIELMLLGSQNRNFEFIKVYSEVLLEKLPIELIELFEKNELESLGNLFRELMDDNKIGEMLFSDKKYKRRFILTLIKNFNLKAQKLQNCYPENEILSDLLIDIASDYFSEKISDLLLVVEPIFSNASKNIRDDFIALMLYQGTNLPGACFQKWKEISPKSEILEIVCSKLDSYFSSLFETRDIFPEKFGVYHFTDAAQQKRIIDSRELSSQVREKSMFLRMLNQVPLLYGKQFTFVDSEATVKTQILKPITHEFEYPRMALIDPEGSIYLRMYYKTKYEEKSH